LTIPGGKTMTSVASSPKKLKKDTVVGKTSEVTSIQVVENSASLKKGLLRDSVAPVVEKATIAPIIPAISSAKDAEPLDDKGTFDYTVEEGESIEDIAKDFIVTVKDIRKYNALAPGQSLKKGQVIRIPPAADL